MTTTQLFGFGHYTSNASVEDAVTAYVGEFAADYDIDGMTDAYRDDINRALEADGSSIRLHGDDFYSDYPAPMDAAETIKAAMESVDLEELGRRFDTAE